MSRLGALLLGLFICASGSARAQSSGGENPQPPPPSPDGKPFPTEATPPVDDGTTAYLLPESNLVAVPRTTQTPAHWTGDIPPAPVPGYIVERLEEHGSFVQPYLQPAVFPEFSARLLNDGGYSEKTKGGDMDQLFYGSLYVFDFYIPLLTLHSDTPQGTNHVRINLKAPFIMGKHAFTLFFGGNIPTSGVWTANGGYNLMFGYSYGGAVAVQARAGFGYDQLIAENFSPLATSFLADATLGIPLGTPHAQLLLEADGRKLLGEQGGTLRLWPGVRVFPLDLATLSIAAGATVWWDSYDAAGVEANGPFGLRRAGGYLEVGWVFY